MAMCCHAAGDSGLGLPGTVAVVLQVADEAELLALWADIHAPSDTRINDTLFFESDGEYAGQAMAIGYLSPQGKSGLLSHLRLWRPKT
jgi:hypothetical protein